MHTALPSTHSTRRVSSLRTKGPLGAAAFLASAVASLVAVAPAALAATNAPLSGARTLVRVQFEGLSPLASVAEAQKDILLQMLREVSPTQGVFLEWDGSTPSSSLETAGSRLTVRCRPCATPDPSDTFEPTSLQILPSAPRGPLTHKNVRFLVSTSPRGVGAHSHTAREVQSKPHWQVEIETQPPRYVVRLTRDIRAGERLGLEHAAVETCYGARTCGTAHSFRRESEAFAFHESIVGQEATRTLSAGGSLTSREVRPPLVVRMGDLVSVRVVGSSEGMLIRTPGRALQAGKEGDSILVETQAFGANSSSASSRTRRTLQATVKGKGEVEYALH